MRTATITKGEYTKLVAAKRKLAALFKVPSGITKKAGFFDGAFGVLKGRFGGVSSKAYVAKTRKAWR
ncbi:hypothetical protein HYZ80_01295 [Candidatus Parcubacteria bacterium]|nr:hypothetical protein [Candidatus Parcubacteria bacterium]